MPTVASAVNFETDVTSGSHKLHSISTEHFMIEFSPAVYNGTDDDADGVPDLVEKIAEYAEFSWEAEIDELGMPTPLDDQDIVYLILDDRNFYISRGTLGVTGILPSDEIYIAVDPSLSDELLQVTVAHELFHVIQFGYQGYFAGYDQDINFAEQTATWSEEYVYDEVNDYYDYLYHYFENTDYSVLTGVIPEGSLFEYGAAIWPIFLSEYYDDWTLIKDVVNAYFYEEVPDVWDAYEAYYQVISEQGDDIRDVYMTFAYWNYIWTPYEEGMEYPFVAIHNYYWEDEYPVENDSVSSFVLPALFGANYLQFYLDADDLDSDFQLTVSKDAEIDLGLIVLPESEYDYLTDDAIWSTIEAGDEEGTITLPLEEDYTVITVMVMPLSEDPTAIETEDEAFSIGYNYYYSVELGDFLEGDTYEVSVTEESEVEVEADDDDKEGDAAGDNISGWSEEDILDDLTVTEIDLTSVGEDYVTLNWTRVDGAAGYYVYYGMESGDYYLSNVIDGAHITHATVTDLWEDTFYFVVTAYDEDYNESAYYSNEVQADIAGVNFSDVYPNHKNYEAIKFLTYLGVLEGYEDGTFKPDKEINRAELIKVMVYGWLSETPPEDEYSDCFPDVTDEWFAPYVCYAYEQGWVQGYNDGNFYPANTVSKVEALKMIMESYGIEVPDWANLNDLPYDDVYSSAWYAPYLATAYEMGLLEETEGSFNPNDGRTRAEVSEEIFRILVLDWEEVDVYTEEVLESFLEDWGDEFL